MGQSFSVIYQRITEQVANDISCMSIDHDEWLLITDSPQSDDASEKEMSQKYLKS